MTKEKLNKIVEVLANGRVYNTSEDFSLSLSENVYNGNYYGRIDIFPNNSKKGFYGHIIPYLWAIAVGFGVFMSFEVMNGTVVCELD